LIGVGGLSFPTQAMAGIIGLIELEQEPTVSVDDDDDGEVAVALHWRG
jgi:hypothetical protein